ncbi:MAG: hypothetical protein J6D30_05985 [Clostridia bacterium]|nr:hypothetical protein [Clostridia bacterium]
MVGARGDSARFADEIGWNMQKRWKKVALGLAAVFSILSTFGCVQERTQDLTLYVPDGAPAMAFAPMMERDSATDGVEYRVVAPNLIASKVTYKAEEKNADLCVLPVTAAAKLLGDGTRYVCLGVVTSGNLYILSKDEELIAALEQSAYRDISYLTGKTVGVMKINDMPGLTFKWAVNAYGEKWQEIGNDGTMSATKINLKAIADATAIDPTDKNVAAYLVAEPAASVQVQKNGFRIVCSLETLYHQGETLAETEYQGYPQAVLVAKKAVVDSKKAWLDGFLNDLAESTEQVNGAWATGEKIVSAVQTHREDLAYVSTLKAGVLTAETIARCKIGFVENAKSKTAVQAYLERIVAMNVSATRTVGDEFFYIG